MHAFLKRLELPIWILVTVAMAIVIWFKLQEPAAPIEEKSEDFHPVFAPQDSSATLRQHVAFAGKGQMRFFGLADCSNICPATLSDVPQELGPEAARVQPLFISVDPERDRASGLETYTSGFDLRIDSRSVDPLGDDDKSPEQSLRQMPPWRSGAPRSALTANRDDTCLCTRPALNFA